MTAKELKKLNRAELLEIMVAQSKRIEELEKEVEELTQKVETKEITIDTCGSIAEAALKLNKVFEAAQLAADQYLENVNRLCNENKSNE